MKYFDLHCDTIGAVSYTHLDVYKRQHMDNTEQTRQELINFDKMIKRENNTLYNTAAGKQILLLRKCNFKLFGAFCFYSKLKE